MASKDQDKKMKFEGIVVVPFKIRKKEYEKSDIYATDSKASFDTLLNSKRIKKQVKK